MNHLNLTDLATLHRRCFHADSFISTAARCEIAGIISLGPEWKADILKATEALALAIKQGPNPEDFTDVRRAAGHRRMWLDSNHGRIAMNDHTTTDMEHVLLTEDERRLKAATSNVLRPLPAGTAEEIAELIEALREINKREETP